MLQPEAAGPGEEDALEVLWAAEAEDRLAAYQRGEIASIPLAEVLAKYPCIRPLER